MADTEAPKSTTERTLRRKIAQLQPVRYDITLHYLGPRWCKRDETTPAADEESLLTSAGANYRCEFDLCEADRVLPVQTPIPTVIAREDDLSDLGKFTGESGVPNAPTGKPDKEYRIKILDWHGARATENLDLLGDNGSQAQNSNPRYYRRRGWLPDVVPCVPFRIIVKKFVGDLQVDFTDNGKDGDKKPDAIVEIKDPGEERSSYATAAARPKEFLKEFFDEFNHSGAGDPVGGDNASDRFNGARPHAGGQVNPETAPLLRKMEFKEEPTLQQRLDGEGSPVVPKNHLSAATAHNTRQAKFTLEAKKLEDHRPTVGVADFAFVPPPIGGDNYRFMIGLEMDGGDLRNAEMNGATIKMTVGGRYELPNPYQYTSGRFVIWRKTPWELALAFNGLTGNEADWSFISDVYERAFIEVGRPRRIEKVSREKWIELLKSVFPGNTADLDNDANVTQAIYEAQGFPPVLGVPANQMKQRMIELMRVSLDWATTKHNLPLPIQDRASDASRFNAQPMTWQNDRAGCFMQMARTMPGASTLGSYFGDRCFWMVRPSGGSGDDYLTSTTAHEFGHLKSLRHSHTSSEACRIDGANRAVIGARRNDRPMDHDGKDAYACLMGYTRALDAELCGMCLLSMRFFDRVQIQQAGNYKDEIVDLHGPVGFYTAQDAPLRYDSLDPATRYAIPNGQLFDISILGPEVQQTSRSGGNPRYRANFTAWPRDEAPFSVERVGGGGNATVTLHEVDRTTAYATITATHVGDVNIHYRRNQNTTAVLQLRVT